jgi:hypothetical protein
MSWRQIAGMLAQATVIAVIGAGAFSLATYALGWF